MPNAAVIENENYSIDTSETSAEKQDLGISYDSTNSLKLKAQSGCGWVNQVVLTTCYDNFTVRRVVDAEDKDTFLNQETNGNGWTTSTHPTTDKSFHQNTKTASVSVITVGPGMMKPGVPDTSYKSEGGISDGEEATADRDNDALANSTSGAKAASKGVSVRAWRAGEEMLKTKESKELSNMKKSLHQAKEVLAEKARRLPADITSTGSKSSAALATAPSKSSPDKAEIHCFMKKKREQRRQAEQDRLNEEARQKQLKEDRLRSLELAAACSVKAKSGLEKQMAASSLTSSSSHLPDQGFENDENELSIDKFRPQKEDSSRMLRRNKDLTDHVSAQDGSSRLLADNNQIFNSQEPGLVERNFTSNSERDPRTSCIGRDEISLEGFPSSKRNLAPQNRQPVQPQQSLFQPVQNHPIQPHQFQSWLPSHQLSTQVSEYNHSQPSKEPFYAIYPGQPRREEFPVQVHQQSAVLQQSSQEVEPLTEQEMARLRYLVSVDDNGFPPMTPNKSLSTAVQEQYITTPASATQEQCIAQYNTSLQEQHIPSPANNQPQQTNLVQSNNGPAHALKLTNLVQNNNPPPLALQHHTSLHQQSPQPLTEEELERLKFLISSKQPWEQLTTMPVQCDNNNFVPLLNHRMPELTPVAGYPPWSHKVTPGTPVCFSSTGYAMHAALGTTELKESSVEEIKERITAMLPPAVCYQEPPSCGVRQGGLVSNNRHEHGPTHVSGVATEHSSNGNAAQFRPAGDMGQEFFLPSSQQRVWPERLLNVDNLDGVSHGTVVSSRGQANAFIPSSSGKNAQQCFSSQNFSAMSTQGTSQQHPQSQSVLNIFRPAQNKTLSPNYINFHKVLSSQDYKVVNESATTIQAAYRGYKVRKVTGHVLNRNLFPLSGMSRKLQLTKKRKYGPESKGTPSPQASISARKIKSHDSGPRVHLHKYHADDNLQTDPVKFRGDVLWLGHIKPLSDVRYRVTNPSVPDRVKPYVELMKTGNVDEFVNSRGTELEPMNRMGVGSGGGALKLQGTRINLNSRREVLDQPKFSESQNRGSTFNNDNDFGGLQSQGGPSLPSYNIKGDMKERGTVDGKHFSDKEVQTGTRMDRSATKALDQRSGLSDTKAMMHDTRDKTSKSRVAGERPHRTARSSEDDSDFVLLKPKAKCGMIGARVASAGRSESIANIPGANFDHSSHEGDSAMGRFESVRPTYFSTPDLTDESLKRLSKNNVEKKLESQRNGVPGEVKRSTRETFLAESASTSTVVTDSCLRPESHSANSTSICKDVFDDQTNDRNRQYPKPRSRKGQHGFVPMIDSRTGIGMSPLELKQRFDAELLHQDAVAAALQHLADLERLRDLANAEQNIETGVRRHNVDHLSSGRIGGYQQNTDRIGAHPTPANESIREQDLSYLRQQPVNWSQYIEEQHPKTEHLRNRVNVDRIKAELERDRLEAEENYRLQQKRVELEQQQERQRLQLQKQRLQQEEQSLKLEQQRIQFDQDKRRRLLDTEIEIERRISRHLERRVVLDEPLKIELSIEELERKAMASLEKLTHEVHAKADALFLRAPSSAIAGRGATDETFARLLHRDDGFGVSGTSNSTTNARQVQASMNMQRFNTEHNSKTQQSTQSPLPQRTPQQGSRYLPVNPTSSSASGGDVRSSSLPNRTSNTASDAVAAVEKHRLRWNEPDHGEFFHSRREHRKDDPTTRSRQAVSRHSEDGVQRVAEWSGSPDLDVPPRNRRKDDPREGSPHVSPHVQSHDSFSDNEVRNNSSRISGRSGSWRSEDTRVDDTSIADGDSKVGDRSGSRSCTPEEKSSSSKISSSNGDDSDHSKHGPGSLDLRMDSVDGEPESKSVSRNKISKQTTQYSSSFDSPSADYSKSRHDIVSHHSDGSVLEEINDGSRSSSPILSEIELGSVVSVSESDVRQTVSIATEMSGSVVVSSSSIPEEVKTSSTPDVIQTLSENPSVAKIMSGSSGMKELDANSGEGGSKGKVNKVVGTSQKEMSDPNFLKVRRVGSEAVSLKNVTAGNNKSNVLSVMFEKDGAKKFPYNRLAEVDTANNLTPSPYSTTGMEEFTPLTPALASSMSTLGQPLKTAPFNYQKDKFSGILSSGGQDTGFESAGSRATTVSSLPVTSRSSSSGIGGPNDRFGLASNNILASSLSLSQNGTRQDRKYPAIAFPTELNHEPSNAAAGAPSLAGLGGGILSVIPNADVVNNTLGLTFANELNEPSIQQRIDESIAETLINGGLDGGGSSNILTTTLSLLQSLYDQEELKFQHHKSLLKMQEQAMIEEVKHKLTLLQTESPSSVRKKKQRAVLLQLRDQRLHIKKIVEALQLAAQQNKLILSQHQQLLANSTGAYHHVGSGGGSRSAGSTRGHSPVSVSPLMSKLLDIGGLSTSSEDLSATRLSSQVGFFGKRDPVGSKCSVLSGGKSVQDRRSFSEEESSPSRNRNSSSTRPRGVHLSPGKCKLGADRKKITSSKRDKELQVPANDSSGQPATTDSSSVISETKENSEASAFEGDFLPHSIMQRSKQEDPESKKLMTKALDAEHLEPFVGQISMQSTHSQTDIIQVPAGETNVASSSSLKTTQLEHGQVSTEEGITCEEESHRLATSSQSENRHHLSVVQDSSPHPVFRSLDLATEISGGLGTTQQDPDNRGSIKQNLLGGRGSLFLPIRRSLSPRSPGKHNMTIQLPLDKTLLQESVGLTLGPLGNPQQHWRYSSESDDSFTQSQNETSETSDGEGKLLALQEQLTARKMEAEKLRRERRRLRRERLASQEQALKKQIAIYDTYIQNARQDLDKEMQELQKASAVRPVIKRPESRRSRAASSELSVLASPEKSDVSDFSLISEVSKSDQSIVSAKSQDSVKPVIGGGTVVVPSSSASVGGEMVLASSSTQREERSELAIEASHMDKAESLLDASDSHHTSVDISSESVKSSSSNSNESDKSSVASIKLVSPPAVDMIEIEEVACVVALEQNNEHLEKTRSIEHVPANKDHSVSRKSEIKISEVTGRVKGTLPEITKTDAKAIEAIEQLIGEDFSEAFESIRDDDTSLSGSFPIDLMNADLPKKALGKDEVVSLEIIKPSAKPSADFVDSSSDKVLLSVDKRENKCREDVTNTTTSEKDKRVGSIAEKPLLSSPDDTSETLDCQERQELLPSASVEENIVSASQYSHEKSASEIKTVSEDVKGTPEQILDKDETSFTADSTDDRRTLELTLDEEAKTSIKSISDDDERTPEQTSEKDETSISDSKEVDEEFSFEESSGASGSGTAATNEKSSVVDISASATDENSSAVSASPAGSEQPSGQSSGESSSTETVAQSPSKSDPNKTLHSRAGEEVSIVPPTPLGNAALKEPHVKTDGKEDVVLNALPKNKIDSVVQLEIKKNVEKRESQNEGVSVPALPTTTAVKSDEEGSIEENLEFEDEDSDASDELKSSGGMGQLELLIPDTDNPLLGSTNGSDSTGEITLSTDRDRRRNRDLTFMDGKKTLSPSISNESTSDEGAAGNILMLDDQESENLPDGDQEPENLVERDQVPENLPEELLLRSSPKEDVNATRDVWSALEEDTQLEGTTFFGDENQGATSGDGVVSTRASDGARGETTTEDVPDEEEKMSLEQQDNELEVLEVALQTRSMNEDETGRESEMEEREHGQLERSKLNDSVEMISESILAGLLEEATKIAETILDKKAVEADRVSDKTSSNALPHSLPATQSHYEIRQSDIVSSHPVKLVGSTATETAKDLPLPGKPTGDKPPVELEKLSGDLRSMTVVSLNKQFATLPGVRQTQLLQYGTADEQEDDIFNGEDADDEELAEMLRQLQPEPSESARGLMRADSTGVSAPVTEKPTPLPHRPATNTTSTGDSTSAPVCTKSNLDATATSSAKVSDALLLKSGGTSVRKVDNNKISDAVDPEELSSKLMALLNSNDLTSSSEGNKERNVKDDLRSGSTNRSKLYAKVTDFNASSEEDELDLGSATFDLDSVELQTLIGEESKLTKSVEGEKEKKDVNFQFALESSLLSNRVISRNRSRHMRTGQESSITPSSSEFDPQLESMLKSGSQRDHLGEFDVKADFGVASSKGSWHDDDFWTKADDEFLGTLSTKPDGRAKDPSVTKVSTSEKTRSLTAKSSMDGVSDIPPTPALSEGTTSSDVAVEAEREAELKRVRELQQLELQYPGLVIREVPDRPPPPYTPPSSRIQSSTTSTSPQPLDTKKSSILDVPPWPKDILSGGSGLDLESGSSVISVSRLQQLAKIVDEATTGGASVPSGKLPKGTLAVDTPASTPRRMSRSDLQQLTAAVQRAVPSERDAAHGLANSALDTLCRAWLVDGQRPDTVERPPTFGSSTPVSPSHTSDGVSSLSRDAFHQLLFDTVRQLVQQQYEQHHGTNDDSCGLKLLLPGNGASTASAKPWRIRQRPVAVIRPSASESSIRSSVLRQLDALLGHAPALHRPPRLLRWAGKRRDLVDQVLVRELAVEEASWTVYDDDEEDVKRRLAVDLLQGMITDTATLFAQILASKGLS